MSKILPPGNSEEMVQFSVKFPKSLAKRLDEIGREQGHSRNGVLLHFARWALEEYEKEQKGKR